MFIDQQGRVVTSASDLTAATACEFSWLRQLDEKLGRIDKLERTEDAMLARAAELGDVHEERVFDRYRQDAAVHSGRVVEIDRPDVRNPESTQAAVQATLDAFHAGADVVFHLAAVTAARDEAAYDRANAQGTRTVVRAALAAAPRPRRRNRRAGRAQRRCRPRASNA